MAALCLHGDVNRNLRGWCGSISKRGVHKILLPLFHRVINYLERGGLGGLYLRETNTKKLLLDQ